MMLPCARRPAAGWAGLLASLLAVLGLAVSTARAAPIARAEADNLVIVLHDEPCSPELAAVVTNMPSRATWKQAGEPAVEGCWRVSPYGVVAFYFADRTVGVVPVRIFSRVEPT